MSKQTVYLTFDDGPLSGSDDVIQVLNAKKVPGTLFMVGTHVSNSWRKNQLVAAQKSPYVEVGNHSNTHANNRYEAYYNRPDDVVEGFEKANKILDLKGPKIIARLPGRNTWRVVDIIQNDLGSGNAADLLSKQGFTIYGWDVEWNMTAKGLAIGEPEDIVKKIQKALSTKGTKKKDKVILLMHDIMFRASTGGKKKLEMFIDLMTQEGYRLDFVSNY